MNDSSEGQRLADALVELLDLEPIELDIFRGRSPEDASVRVFGGQVAGQALVAAGRTVELDRGVHSLHSYFIRPGDPSVPIVYTVDRVRDGRSFSTRRVVAVQHGQAIFTLSASFQLAQGGLDHQSPMPDSPDPTTLASRGSHDGKVDWPFDVRPVPPAKDGGAGSSYLTWMKATGRLPDDPLLHVCALTYGSDLTLLDTVLIHHGHPYRRPPGMRTASLDHAVWFHRPFRADSWLLYQQESPSASGGRGLSMARVFSADGRQVATVMQEGMIRLPN